MRLTDDLHIRKVRPDLSGKASDYQAVMSGSREQRKSNPVEHREGIVQSIQADNTVTATIGGSSTAIAGIHTLGTRPTVGAPSIFIQIGSALYCFGSTDKAYSSRQPTCVARRASALALTANVAVNVIWDGTDQSDTDSMHDPTSNASLITVPTDGYYDLKAQVRFQNDATASAYVDCRFILNAGGTILTEHRHLLHASLYTDSIFVMPGLFMVAGSAVKVQLISNVAAVLDFSNNNIPYFSVERRSV